MNLSIKVILGILLYTISFYSCRNTAEVDIRPEFKRYYDQFNVNGSFILYDQKENHYIFYDKLKAEKPYTPASTFKIWNSMIGLETAVIADKHFVIAWDSVVRQVPSWNRDHDLESAYKNSAVWYYQELARRVGGEQMKYWLDTLQYGNADTSGGIDRFWLDGGMRITPMQQIELLKRLTRNDLPFSERSVEIVNSIMIMDKSEEYTLRGKTGWGFQDEEAIGWFVGYLQTANNVYCFSNCVESSIPEPADFARSRIDIVYLILKDLIILY